VYIESRSRNYSSLPKN